MAPKPAAEAPSGVGATAVHPPSVTAAVAKPASVQETTVPARATPFAVAAGAAEGGPPPRRPSRAAFPWLISKSLLGIAKDGGARRGKPFRSAPATDRPASATLRRRVHRRHM
ncbi:hypothetical protein GCM10009416_44190 [Craurococcus roseus]|uniref:Uncharacterized protein n=1 Tax=Craurococcus roseus TaxID=77585 RepID=A0ABN1G0C0_9PROT